jgi:hypothetical protein
VDESVDLVESILHLTGWTQSRLVYELRAVARSLHEPEPTGLQPVTVNRWKRGRQRPGPYYQRLLRLLYTAICEELAAENEEGEEMKRRQFFGFTAALVGGLAIDPDRLTAALVAGSGADSRLVNDLSASIAARARRWHTDQPDALLPLVRSDLATVNELRMGRQDPGAGRRLVSLTSQTAALAGWLAWQFGNDEAANAYYTFAYSLASEVQDRDDRAFVLTLRSFMGSGLFGAKADDDGLALPMLREAVDLTGGSASPFLRVFALGRRAEELARTGGLDAARRDLDLAQTLLASAGTPHNGFFRYFGEGRLTGCRGTCAMVGGWPQEAVGLLSAVLDATPQELVAERSVLVADLGAAHAMLGEVEQACLLLGRSLDLGGHGHANRVGRVRAIRATHLARWSDAPAVARLDEQLFAMT